MTRPVFESICDTGVSGIVTRTEPPPAAMHPPFRGTSNGIVEVTWFVGGLIRDTAPSPWPSTQTPFGSAVRKRGDAATGIVARTLPVGSTRTTVSCALFVPQMLPKATTTDARPGSSAYFAVTLFVVGSIRERRPLKSGIQTAPALTAI
jgi:hypothetical protein